MPTLEHTWPSGAAATVPPPSAAAPATAPSAPPAEASVQTPRPDERVAQQDPPRAPEPPQKTFEELVVSADSVIGLQAETPVSSDRARIEDRVEARVTRDVRVGDTVAIPAGSRALGTVVQVERGGKFKETARLGIRFNTLVLADGTRLPITTETILSRRRPRRATTARRRSAGCRSAARSSAPSSAAARVPPSAPPTGAAPAPAPSWPAIAAPRRLAPGEPFTVRILSPVTVTIEQK